MNQGEFVKARNTIESLVEKMNLAQLQDVATMLLEKQFKAFPIKNQEFIANALPKLMKQFDEEQKGK
jgi:formate dehydrogenase maturation protein FdhE